jgi:agmatine/peptidylarginine deiminase
MRDTLLALLALPLLTACGQSGGSNLWGHFEESSWSELRQRAGMQLAYPEYLPAKGVIIGQGLIGMSYQHPEFIDAFLNVEGVKLLVAAVSGAPTNINDSGWSVLREAVGDRTDRVKIVAAGAQSVWARDWAPITAFELDGNGDPSGKQVALDFNYLPERIKDDAVPARLAYSLRWQRMSLPIYNEGGNFMINSRGHCLMTETVIQANGSKVAQKNDKVLDADQITDYYKRFVGCSEVYIFPAMPQETTGHIDIWAKFLDDNTVLVHALDEPTVEAAEKTGGFGDQAREIQAYLEARVTDLKSLGYDVVTIPMPAPEGKVVRSFINSLTLNGTAFVPSYSSATAKKLLPKAVKAYERAGYTVVTLLSDDLVEIGGAVHCVTMQFGRGE